MTPEDPCRDPASEARDDWEQLCQPLTDEERRENARKIEALSVPDRFSLMFGNASEPRATPETDAASFSAAYQGELVRASFARRLERQRDEAREHAANAEASLIMAINSANARQTETEHAMRQRDELMDALERLTHHRPIMGSTGDYREAQMHVLESVERIATAAIAAVKGGPQ
jgi:hypothetical protein